MTRAVEGAEHSARDGLVEGPSGTTLIGPAGASTNTLGESHAWPQSLRTAIALIDESPLPCCLVWGPARVEACNDAFRALCRPQSLTDQDLQREAGPTALWPSLNAAIHSVFGGNTDRIRNEPAWIFRDNRLSRAVLSLTLTPVRDETGSIAGVLVSVIGIGVDEELRQANRDLDSLNYAISHDLHSPLRTMQEMMRIIRAQSSTSDDEEAGAFLAHLEKGAEKLEQRVQGLVRFARVSRQVLSFRTVDMESMLRSITAELAAAKLSRATISISSPMPAATADEGLLREAFRQLLSNACKFTRDGSDPRIEISASQEPHQIEYRVSDNGVGFDMKYAAKLFGLFQRMHSDAQFEGSGTGLALARRIIERHGGRLEAEAVQARGATFRVMLPALPGPGGTRSAGRPGETQR